MNMIDRPGRPVPRSWADIETIYAWNVLNEYMGNLGKTRPDLDPDDIPTPADVIWFRRVR